MLVVGGLARDLLGERAGGVVEVQIAAVEAEQEDQRRSRRE